MKYAKFIVAVIGASVTAALGIIPVESNLFTVLTILSAAVTAAGVYLAPNTGTAETATEIPIEDFPDDGIGRHSA